MLSNFGFLNSWLARGAQPDAHGFDDLRLMGFEFSYKLNPSSGTDSFPRDEESRLFAGGEVWEDPYPSVLVFRPDPAGMRRSVEQVHGLVLAQKKTFIHCRHGRERTGALAGSYRIWIDRWNADRTIHEFQAYGAAGFFIATVDHEIVEYFRAIAAGA